MMHICPNEIAMLAGVVVHFLYLYRFWKAH